MSTTEHKTKERGAKGATASRIRVLLVEDNPGDASLIEAYLAEGEAGQFELHVVPTLAEALKLITDDQVDVVLLDLGLPDSVGLATFQSLHIAAPEVPVIVLTGQADEELAVKAVQKGAQDYLPKGQADGGLLARAIRYAVERSRIKQVLENDRNLLRALIDALPDHIYVKDENRRFVLCNNAVAKFFGLASADAIVGKTDFDLLSHELARQFEEEERMLLRGDAPLVHRETAFGERDGRTHWVITTKVALRDSHGVITGLVGINRDISERKWAEEQLHQLNLDLARSQKELVQTYENLRRANEELKATQMKLIQAEKMESIGRLAAGVAHEVKNPLATLLMGVDYLAENVKGGGEDVAMTLAEMQEAVKRADGIIHGLLDVAASGRLEVAQASLNGIIEQSLLLTYHELHQKRIHVVKRLASDLPPLRIDSGRIEQVFINVFSNAIAVLPLDGELCVTTTVTREADGRSKVVASVEDNGPGIPPDVLSRVFDPFFSTKPTGMGQGLGLAVARNILAMHGGTIEMSNRPEGGACVTLTLYA